MKTVYYFTADWCQPCKKTRPIVEQYDRDQTETKFQIIDVDGAMELVKSLGVASVPTFILFEDGEEKRRVSGGQTLETLIKFING